MEILKMKYTEILEELKKRGAGKIQPFVPFADWHDHENGFVVLPDGLPVDYLDPVYQSIDTKPNIKPEDLMQGISWHGETNHDNEAVEKLKELNVFVSDLVAKIFFFRLQMEQVATNQNNQSAKKLSEEAKKMLENVVKMATKEENWGAIPELFKGESND